MGRPVYTIALLGASNIAPKAIIAPALAREDCRIVALACRDVARGQSYAREHGLGDIDVVSDYAQIGERSDVDIVYNALPPSRHLETARACMGKVQLIEKPFAMSTADARAMTALPGVMMEAMHHRYHPAMGEFLRRAKTLGRLTHMTGRFHVEIPNTPGQLRYIPELGGGGFYDLGVYPLSIARWVAGREPTVSRARAIWGETGVDLNMDVQLDFGDGLSADISSDMTPGVERVNYFEVAGEHGSLRFENPVHPYRGATINRDSDPRWLDVTTYAAQLAHLIACLRMGGVPLTGGAEAVAQMAAVEAVYETAAAHRR